MIFIAEDFEQEIGTLPQNDRLSVAEQQNGLLTHLHDVLDGERRFVFYEIGEKDFGGEDKDYRNILRGIGDEELGLQTVGDAVSEKRYFGIVDECINSACLPTTAILNDYGE
jgi:hypothetical protein